MFSGGKMSVGFSTSNEFVTAVRSVAREIGSEAIKELKGAPALDSFIRSAAALFSNIRSADEAQALRNRASRFAAKAPAAKGKNFDRAEAFAALLMTAEKLDPAKAGEVFGKWFSRDVAGHIKPKGWV